MKIKNVLKISLTCHMHARMLWVKYTEIIDCQKDSSELGDY